MTYYWLLAFVTLAAWTITNVFTSLVVWGWWHHMSGHFELVPPAKRTRLLFAARVAPTFGATIVAVGIVAPSFHRFEVRGSEENLGWILTLLAAISMALVVPAVVRGARTVLMAGRLRRECEQIATPIDLEGSPVRALCGDFDFPIVAVVGAFRPQLVIARRVLEACDRDEIASIIAHERNHISRFDNLRRLVFDCCPDVLQFTRVGRNLADCWHLGAEELADDSAAAAWPGSSADLASALVRVAKLASGCAPRALPVSALFSGGNIERRVKRLLQTEPLAQAHGVSVVKPIAVAVFLVAAWSAPGARVIYEVVEHAVKSLP